MWAQNSTMISPSVLQFCPNYLIKSRLLLGHSVSINFHAVPWLPAVSYPPLNVNYLFSKQKPLLRTSSEGVSSDLLEDSKFVPLNAEDPRYGPPALLLLGFEADEALKIQELLKDMDGEFLKVIYCTEDMINRSLWEVMHTMQPDLKEVKIAKLLPRICILSGLSGEEMMMLIDAFPETGLEPAVFAALVPNSANKPLHELIEEIMGDHEMLSTKGSNST